ncbi:CLUMA_CG000428, isoform A [Clunio marinus]|uniref:CLUMA_CG000428, isoform A n=1 Tax=Clunio marinus TaxID=568069 RepID=A0A1J1HIY6_9DIPT|nr:CLUMA_CG000428, isoform A [Clunio marinus]
MGNIVNRRKTERDIPTPEIIPLTTKQIDIVRRTWEIPSAKLYDSGEKILFMYFDRFPNNQDRFIAFKTTPLLMLKGTPGFRAHASKIMNVLSSIIDALDKDPALVGIKKIAGDGREAWEKLLNILYHVVFECIDGRSDEFN